MDFITKNPGLHHIVEETFMNLDYENLLKCQEVNEHWKKVLDNPWFWMKKCKELSMHSFRDQTYPLLNPRRRYNNPFDLLHMPDNSNMTENLTAPLIELHQKFSSIASTESILTSIFVLNFLLLWQQHMSSDGFGYPKTQNLGRKPNFYCT